MSSSSSSSTIAASNTASLPVSEEERCPICMSSIQQPTQPDSCKHTFCYGCMKQWTLHKVVCPLCNSKISFLKTDLTGEGKVYTKEDVVEPAARPGLDIESDLACLDHTYFIGEALRMLALAQQTQRNMLKVKVKVVPTRFGSQGLSKNAVLMEDILGKLRQYVVLFQSDAQFDPYCVLQDLYSIQDQITVVCRYPNGQPESEDQSVAPARYGADNYDELSSDSEEEDFGDDWEGSGSKKEAKKPWRKPPPIFRNHTRA